MKINNSNNNSSNNNNNNNNKIYNKHKLHKIYKCTISYLNNFIPLCSYHKINNMHITYKT